MPVWRRERSSLKRNLYLGVGMLLLMVIAIAAITFYLLMKEVEETDRIVAQEFEYQRQDREVVLKLERLIGLAQGYTAIWDDAVLSQHRKDIRGGIDDIREIMSDSSRFRSLHTEVERSLDLLSVAVSDVFTTHAARSRFHFFFEGNQYDLSRFILLVHQDLSHWVDQLSDAARFHVPFQGNLDVEQSLYTRWYRGHENLTADLKLDRMLQRYQQLNRKIHRFGQKVDGADSALKESHFVRGVSRQILKANIQLRKIEHYLNPLFNQVNQNEARAISDLRSHIERFREMIAVFGDEGEARIEESKMLLAQFQSRIYTLFFWVMVALLTLSMVLATRFVRSIHQPVDAITGVIHRISREGNLGYRVERFGDGEIADAAIALNQLLDNLEEVFAHTQEIMERVAEGDYKARIEVEVKGDLLKLKRSINQGITDLHASMEEINQVLIAISFGNYNYRVEGEYHGALNVTKENINIAAEALQKKTVALVEAKATLEQRVVERTQQLEEMNRDLEVEIAQRKQAQQKLKQMAHYDVLTGLPNRALLMDRLHIELARADRDSTRIALIFIDLDGFKQVNDTMGHAAGDLLLVEVGNRLRQIVREVDTVSRLGGDEFILLLVGWREGTFIDKIAQQVIEQLSRPISLQNRGARIGASLGIACYPDHAESAEQLMKRADQAMYRAKARGKGCYHHYGELL